MTKRELVMDMAYGPNRDIKEDLLDMLNRIADAWEADTKDTARLDKLQRAGSVTLCEKDETCYFICDGNGHHALTPTPWDEAHYGQDNPIVPLDLRSAIDAMGVK